MNCVYTDKLVQADHLNTVDGYTGYYQFLKDCESSETEAVIPVFHVEFKYSQPNVIDELRRTKGIVKVSREISSRNIFVVLYNRMVSVPDGYIYHDRKFFPIVQHHQPQKDNISNFNIVVLSIATFLGYLVLAEFF